MTIDEIGKAIKILRQDIDDPGSVAIEDVNTAEELAIKALEADTQYREYLVVIATELPIIRSLLKDIRDKMPHAGQFTK